MARFYSNENFPRGAIDVLRAMGHDVLTSHEAGQANMAIADAAVLRYSIAESRALLTLNRGDFIKLHRQGIAHAGVVVCKLRTALDYAALANQIHAAVEAGAVARGRLVRVYEDTWSDKE